MPDDIFYDFACSLSEYCLNTYKQVLNMVNSLVGNDYTEVLTFTRRRRTSRGSRRRKGKRQKQIT